MSNELAILPQFTAVAVNAAEMMHANQNIRTWLEAKLRSALMDELAAGHEVLPTGECEGFSYKTGCPGHEQA